VFEPVNLGNPAPINMRDLANEVIDITGSKSKIDYKPLPGDDPKQREPVIDRASTLLDWKPVVERRVGLAKTVEYFRTSLSK
ncbi:MAG: SDR family NAD-dependent epimerase/dehydratase, partial [Actinobacteria bacterium]|nr:SDR family NAD-dependent epimerase/dehydratase [Actinomycetota bacterium]